MKALPRPAMHPDQTTPEGHRTDGSESDANEAPAPPEISQDAEAETTRADDDE